MPGKTTYSMSGVLAHDVVLPLENGDKLTRAEFERRYEAMPHLKKAELIEGVVYVIGWAITKLALLASKPAITALYGWIWTMSHNQMCCCSLIQPVVARPS